MQLYINCLETIFYQICNLVDVEGLTFSGNKGSIANIVIKHCNNESLVLSEVNIWQTKTEISSLKNFRI